MKQQIRQEKGNRRGEAILDQAQCQCGCDQWDLLDVRHGQKYIKGHGGTAIMERRKVALCFAVEVRLIALGAGLLTAQRAARALVDKALKLARALVEREWDYLAMAWRQA